MKGNAGAILVLIWVFGFGVLCAGAFSANLKLGLAISGIALMASSLVMLKGMLR